MMAKKNMTLEEILSALKKHPYHSLEIDHTPQPFGVEDEDGYEGWRITLYDTRLVHVAEDYLPPHKHVTYKDVPKTIAEFIGNLSAKK